MRLSKETVARREKMAADCFKNGMDIVQVNEALFQIDGHKMAIGRLYELRDQNQPKIKVEIQEEPEPIAEPVQFFAPRAQLSNPDDFSKITTLFKGKIVTVELMEK